MRASLATRAGSVAAAAVIATTGAMATAGAASASTHHARHHARRLPTHLSAFKARAVAHHKHVFVIAGRLTTFRFPLRDRKIVLDRISGKSLVKVGAEYTNKAGIAAFVVDPKVTARFVLVFEGTRHLHSSRSRVLVVRA
jgi:hypothetical protein